MALQGEVDGCQEHWDAGEHSQVEKLDTSPIITKGIRTQTQL